MDTKRHFSLSAAAGVLRVCGGILGLLLGVVPHGWDVPREVHRG